MLEKERENSIVENDTMNEQANKDLMLEMQKVNREASKQDPPPTKTT